MPCTALSKPTIRSRRSRNDARIADAASFGPVIASIAVHCLICDAQDLVLVIQRVNTGASVRLAMYPMRHPVIAQVFDAPSEMMVRSSMPGREASDVNFPS